MRPDGAKVLWNKVYGGHDPIFIQTPYALLASAVLARNAVFLAMQGWDVTGFDPSDEAIRLAQANAAKAGVKIHAVVATDDDVRPIADSPRRGANTARAGPRRYLRL
jgi:hypothetical protein